MESQIVLQCSHRVRALACLIVLSTVTGMSQGQNANLVQTKNEDAEVFTWFDKLGYLDYSKLPLVKVTTESWFQIGNEPPENSTIYAFLLNESETQFTVYTMGLEVRLFTFTRQEAQSFNVGKFERVNLAEYSKSFLREHAERAAAKERDSWRRFGNQLNEGSEVVVLARACAAQNEAGLSRELMVAAIELLEKDRNWNAKAIGFQDAFSEDLANMTMWRIIVDFGNIEVSRAELLTRLKKFLKNYSKSEHYERAKETAEMLLEIQAEEELHEPAKDFDKLTVEQKVAELIFQLRDQNGHQWSQPGSCDIFSLDFMTQWGMEIDNYEKNKLSLSPAGKLVEIGFDAVPQLIKSLDDQRLTRSVGFHRDFYFSHHVLRVGNCAEQILSRIANRGFSEGKEQVETWWNEVQKKGEKQVLIEATMRGDRYARDQARRLVEKYPEVALDAIVQGARSSNASWIRNGMIELAASLGEPAMTFLMAEMDNAPKLKNRLTAARQIAKQNPQMAIDAMVREWKQVSMEASLTESKTDSMSEGVEELIRFLASRNSADCIRVLHEHYSAQSIAGRFEIVTAFGFSTGMVSSSSTGNGGTLNIGDNRLPIEESVKKEVESLLVDALSDTDQREGLSGTWDEYSFIDPRICDVAGHVLMGRFPEKYAFDPKGTPDVLEVQRIHAINQWRAERGIELLAESQPRKIVGALPAVLEAIESMPLESNGLGELRELARQLSLTVTTITFAKDSMPFTGDLQQQLASFEGRQLTESKIVELLISVAHQLPDGASGIKFKANRNHVLTGVELTVALTKVWPPRNGTQQMWHTRQIVSSNNRNLANSNGSWSLDFAKERDAYSDFSKSVREVLSSAADKPFEIQYSLIRDK